MIKTVLGAALHRRVEREWLDDLPPSDDRAIGSRRDLQRLNWLMGHAGIVTSMLASALPRKNSLRFVELGAGDGTFLLRIAQRLNTRGATVEAALIDQHELLTLRTISEFERVGWRVRAARADVLEWLAGGDSETDVILANLFLHHFDDARLAGLLARAAARCDVFLACEPRRSRFALCAAHLMGAVGCNAVTRHDAVVSVRAGFRNRELTALSPRDRTDWALGETSAGMFSHSFCATRAKPT